MHILFGHLEQRLLMYGTIGFFTENCMEYIHAMVNWLRRIHALDGERRTQSIVKAITAAKEKPLRY